MATIAVDFGTTNTAMAFQETGRPVRQIPGWPGGLPSLAVFSKERGYQYTNEGNRLGLIRDAKRRLLVDREMTTTLIWEPARTGSELKYNPQAEVDEGAFTPAAWRVERSLRYDPADYKTAYGAAGAILSEAAGLLEDGLARPLADTDEFIFAVPAQSLDYGTVLRKLLEENHWPVHGNNFRIFSEPYAAIMEFAQGSPQPGTHLVIDVGGGTTDWAVVRVEREGIPPHFSLLWTLRQNAGGSDIDGALLQMLVPQNRAENVAQYHYAIEQTKISVSRTHQSSMGGVFGKTWTLDWDTAVKAMSEVFTQPFQEGVAAVGEFDLSSVILVGGASATPGLQHLLEDLLGRSVTTLKENQIAFMCARGLITAANLWGEVLSGNELRIGYWDWQAQGIAVWFDAFTPLGLVGSKGANSLTKIFDFESEPGLLPIFAGIGTGWTPAGYLEELGLHQQLTPVWNAEKLLGFYGREEEEVQWAHEALPLFYRNMPVEVTGNSLSKWTGAKRGVIESIGPKGLDLWLGETRGQKFKIATDGEGRFWASAPQEDWSTLDVGFRRRITTTDMNMLGVLPMPKLALVPYGVRTAGAGTEIQWRSPFSAEHFALLEALREQERVATSGMKLLHQVWH